MNKITAVFFLFLCICCLGQDAIPPALPKGDTLIASSKFTEENIKTDTEARAPKKLPENLKEKYSGSEFEYEAKTKEKNAWTRFLEWLAYWFRRIFSFSSESSSINFVEIFLKAIAVLVIVFVIYLIVNAIMNGEGTWVFGRPSDKKIIHYDEIEKNLHLADFEKLIKEAAKAGESRLVIRYYYLWLLKKMASNEIIEWDAEKTNSDYIREIKSEKLKKDFSYLSYLYNYIWYGKFKLEEATLEKAVESFDRTIRTL
ncbi:MAG TPA: DUF4129 domain-containing protein [Flavobacterium sp.]|nr:DUF4129 domain-containing protein [Flavobacterium sp.]